MKLVATLLVLLNFTAFADDKRFSLADLEALAKAESWKELSEHLGDVPPTSRNAQWQEIVEKAAVGEIAAEEQPGRRAELAADWIKRYPHLRKSAAVTGFQKTLDFADYEKCFQQSYDGAKCLDSLLAAARRNKDNPEFALKAGALALRSMNASTAVPFFKLGINDKNKGAMCKDEGVQRAIVAALGVKEGADHDAAKDLASTCWPAVKETMVENLAKNPSGFFADSACPILLEKKALKGLLERKCREKNG